MIDERYFCRTCGEDFGQSEVIHFKADTYCYGCKDTFLQRILENGSATLPQIRDASSCPACKAPLPLRWLRTEQERPCPSCDVGIRQRKFSWVTRFYLFLIYGVLVWGQPTATYFLAERYGWSQTVTMPIATALGFLEFLCLYSIIWRWCVRYDFADNG